MGFKSGFKGLSKIWDLKKPDLKNMFKILSNFNKKIMDNLGAERRADTIEQIRAVCCLKPP